MSKLGYSPNLPHLPSVEGGGRPDLSINRRPVVRGYCGIGIVGSKSPLNVGTLWRSAANLGAAFIFTVGRRYPQQASDTIKAYRRIPLFHFAALADLVMPYDAQLVGVEFDEAARPLPAFAHPERAVYLLGAEDSGLSPDARERCQHLVRIESTNCLNVATAGSIVLYDRAAKEALRAAH